MEVEEGSPLLPGEHPKPPNGRFTWRRERLSLFLPRIYEALSISRRFKFGGGCERGVRGLAVRERSRAVTPFGKWDSLKERQLLAETGGKLWPKG